MTCLNFVIILECTSFTLKAIKLRFWFHGKFKNHTTTRLSCANQNKCKIIFILTWNRLSEPDSIAQNGITNGEARSQTAAWRAISSTRQRFLGLFIPTHLLQSNTKTPPLCKRAAYSKSPLSCSSDSKGGSSNVVTKINCHVHVEQ